MLAPQDLFRFVVERSAPVAESNYVAALCVVAAMEAALRDNVPVEDDVLALILARLQAVALKVCHKCRAKDSACNPENIRGAAQNKATGQAHKLIGCISNPNS
jgi:hypothetical protein